MTQSAPFHAVYIGGGTPTELTLEGRINRFSDEMFYSALEGDLTVSLLVFRVLILK